MDRYALTGDEWTALCALATDLGALAAERGHGLADIATTSSRHRIFLRLPVVRRVTDATLATMVASLGLKGDTASVVADLIEAHPEAVKR
jgi:hypothetical protein